MRIEIYGFIIFLHVVSAVIAIGPLFIILPVIKRMRDVNREIENALISVIKVIIRLVMHAGHVLVVTGFLLIIYGPWPWYTPWVILTFFVLAISGFFLATGFTRVLKHFHEPNINKEELFQRLNGTVWLYIVLMLIILWLMVQKPMFW